MGDSVIQVEGIGKRYRVGSQHSVGRTFCEAINDTVRGWTRGSRQSERGTRDFWALRDISFSVGRGEVLGIIGGNGAGKSTLLKLLSRITLPTTGSAHIVGRLASLLEVGTGFHPELTGRENIYLNGTILGMRKGEIDKAFDAIVDFAEVGAFLETPVKRYSSGMYTRLAFAVAAHLNPEIVVVDEVLAVGDEAFQRKCGSRMRQTADGGRTVLLVSHNMGLIQRLCDRTLWLDKGSIRSIGPTDTVLQEYLNQVPRTTVEQDLGAIPRAAVEHDSTRITACQLLGADGERTTELRFGEPFSIRLHAKSTQGEMDVAVAIGIDTASGQRLSTVTSSDAGEYLRLPKTGTASITVRFDGLRLVPGPYQLSLQLRRGWAAVDSLIGVVDFRVSASTWGDTLPYSGAMGVVATEPNWVSDTSELLESAA